MPVEIEQIISNESKLTEMRCLLVSCVFPPEPVVSSQTSMQIAQALVKRGHDVTVITAFPSRPAGKLHPDYSRRLFQRENGFAGFKLVRCFSILSSESRMGSRFLENITFGLTGGWAALVSPRPDVIYANTWPIFATGILFLVSRLRNIPMVISIQDVYPESMVSQKQIRADGLLARWMRWADTFIARRCQAVIVISESFASLYRNERGVAPERLHVVPNWVDSKSVAPDDDRANEFRAKRDIPHGAFVLVYGGNVGAAAGVETVIESFRYLRDIGDVYLVVAGGGSSLETCQQLAEEVACPRILFHTPWPTDETSMVLRAADVLVLPTQHTQSLVSVPSKLISYMLAARSIIALALPQSDLASIIEQSGCGWAVEPDQPELLAAKIREVMAVEPVERVRRGRDGREFALRHLTREVCLPGVIHVLEEAAQKGNHG